MACRPVRGEALARALRARGCELSAGEAALLADRLLDLIAEGLIVPAQLRDTEETADRPTSEADS
jgi:hypothetical protein